ncbi:UNVERIFIED_ORG: amino acid transporter [Rhizobium esperanzae]|uniref:hypothetical protein n=1 Tax=Rhizobium phaseoli TaxID=396 RepID=UPI00055A9220|nr:hypothetical protein [Rhizobium phaseoli]PWI55230.1 hypothetical protein B5K03_04830 [Rhizobium phaseoli]
MPIIYLVITSYCALAVVFLAAAFYHLGKIGYPQQDFYYEDLHQMHWERCTLAALPYLSISLLMVVGPVLWFYDEATALVMPIFQGSDRAIGVALIWLIWIASWFVVAISAVALVGTIYYRMRLAAGHRAQHQAFIEATQIIQIAYGPKHWRRWIQMKRPKRP